MIELSPQIVTVIMITGVLLGVMTGYPLGIMVGGLGLIVGCLIFGENVTLHIIYTRVYSLLTNYPLMAVPLFTFMGVLVERSGIAEGLFTALHQCIGGIRGGLAVSTVLFGTVLAACLGVITASVTMLTIIALPPLLKRGYDKSLATGSCCAGGTLGILIPPSVMLVVYGPMALISVGKLFMGAIFPGLILSGLYCSYILIQCFLHPEMGPPAAAEELKVPFVKKMTNLLTSLFPPVVLIMGVLGSIFLGVAPPTEAAAVGGFASLLLALAYRKFSWRLLKETTLETLRVSGFVLLIGSLAYAFVGVFIAAGCDDVVAAIVLGAPGGRWGAFVIVMFLVFILGMFIDWIGILFIIVPILAPIIPVLGFDPLWFAMMVCINLQMAFLSPPFAPAIFVCRGTAAPELEVTSGNIIRGVVPFILLIMIGLGLCVAFPQIILWLPGQMVKPW